MRIKNKPHLYWRGDYKEWWCSTAHMIAGGTPMGCGSTPQIAYANWLANRKRVAL